MGSASTRGAILPSPPKETRVASLAPEPTAATRAKVQKDYGRVPLHFEANHGQTDPQVQFLARGPGYTVFLTPTEAVLALRKPHQDSLAPASGDRERVRRPTPAVTEPSRAAVVRMQLVGANRKPQVIGLDELPGKVNYFLGNDPTKWRTNVPTYAKVHYKDVYPGVDLVFDGNQRQLEYDFVVAPGADPTAIRLGFEGAEKLEIDGRGDLLLHTVEGELRIHKPRIYQEVNGAGHEIAGGFAFNPQSTTRNLQSPVVSFQVAAYDAGRPLVIDPVLSYSTYLGGRGNDQPFSIAVDAAGNAYVAGTTRSPDFPVSPGAFDPTPSGWDAFVTKLNPTGAALVYSTFLGGSGGETNVMAIAVGATGHAYVTGGTRDPDFPTTPGAFDRTFNEGPYSDAFVAKLDPTGSSLEYSTFLGRTLWDYSYGIATDEAGHAYVTGTTTSPDFPTTPGAFDRTFNGGADAFVTKLNPTGSALVYSTFLGGSGSGGETGTDGYPGNLIAVDAEGHAYVTGVTTSPDFPTTPGAFDRTLDGGRDAYVTKLDPSGSLLVYSTFLGGSSWDWGYAITVDASGQAYVVSAGKVDFRSGRGCVGRRCGSFEAACMCYGASIG